MAGLSYFLFFLPLIVCPESRYAKFHANQSLLLLITGVAGNVILGIMGLINGFGGKAKPLPLIGKFTILK